MFSACGSTNPYGGRSDIKRKLFSKRKTHSVTSDGGLDLKKVKGRHCVETWASIYDQNNTANKLEHQNNHDSLDNHESQSNDTHYSEPVGSGGLVKLENRVETQLVLSAELKNETEYKKEESENPCR